MELLQRAAKDTHREGASPIGHSGLPPGDADGREGPNRISRRSAFAVLLLNLPGGSFAFIMATGIVSLAAIPLGHDNVATALFALNLFAFPLLCVFMLVRLIQHPLGVLSELRDHRTAAGLLTVVAATSILGDQFVLLASNRQVAAALWIGSLTLWIGLVYAFFVAMTIKPVKPPSALGLDGAWLLTVTGDRNPLHTHIRRIFSARYRGLRRAVLLSAGRRLLSDYDFIDCSALAARADAARTAHTIVLDQHGRCVDHNIGGRTPPIGCGCRSADSRAGPVDQGGDSAVLVHCDLVGSTARDTSCLASYRAPDPSIIPIGILVHGVSARDVHGGDLGLIVSRESSISRGDTASLFLDCIDLMASRLCRNDAPSVAPARWRTKELQTC